MRDYPQLLSSSRGGEEVALVFRHGDFRTGLLETRGSPTLIAMMVRVQDPVDPVDVGGCKVICDSAGSGVDQQALLAGFDKVDVTTV